MTTQRGSVTVVSPARGIEHYRLDGDGSVQTVGDAVEKFQGSDVGFDGVVQLNTGAPVKLDTIDGETLRPGDVIVLLDGPVADGGFKAA